MLHTYKHTLCLSHVRALSQSWKILVEKSNASFDRELNERFLLELQQNSTMVSCNGFLSSWFSNRSISYSLPSAYDLRVCAGYYNSIAFLNMIRH